MPVSQKNWYAVYARSRNEKRIYARLVEKNIEAYLPVQKTLVQWSDRKKWVEKLLLSSYVFVYISVEEYAEVVKTAGVVKFVSFEGRAVVIPTNQIENLKLLINSDTEIEVGENEFKEGQKVQVSFGSLKGLRGELIKVGAGKRLLVRIDHIHQNLLVNIPSGYLIKEK